MIEKHFLLSIEGWLWWGHFPSPQQTNNGLHANQLLHFSYVRGRYLFTGMNAFKHQFMQIKDWQGLWLFRFQGGRAETLAQNGQDKWVRSDVYWSGKKTVAAFHPLQRYPWCICVAVGKSITFSGIQVFAQNVRVNQVVDLGSDVAPVFSMVNYTGCSSVMSPSLEFLIQPSRKSFGEQCELAGELKSTCHPLVLNCPLWTCKPPGYKLCPPVKSGLLLVRVNKVLLE